MILDFVRCAPLIRRARRPRGSCLRMFSYRVWHESVFIGGSSCTFAKFSMLDSPFHMSNSMPQVIFRVVLSYRTPDTLDPGHHQALTKKLTRSYWTCAIDIEGYLHIHGATMAWFPNRKEQCSTQLHISKSWAPNVGLGAHTLNCAI